MLNSPKSEMTQNSNNPKGQCDFGDHVRLGEEGIQNAYKSFRLLYLGELNICARYQVWIENRHPWWFWSKNRMKRYFTKTKHWNGLP